MNSGPAVLGIVRILAKLFPYQPPPDLSCDLAALSKQYRKWEIFSIFPIAVFGGLFTYGWYVLFKLLQTAVASNLPPSEFVIVPDFEFWIIPAFFLGLVTSALPTHLLYSLLLGKRYREYLHYSNLRVGCDGWPVFKWLAIAIVVLSVLVTIPALDFYARFTNSDFVVNAFWSFGETTRPLADVKEIRAIATFRALSGRVTERPYHEIVFQDGFRWSTRAGLNEPNGPRDGALMDFVSKQSGKPIMKYQIAPD